MSMVRLGIFDKETSALLANPLDDPRIPGATAQCDDAIQRVGCATASALGRWFCPLVNHRERQSGFRSHLFNVGLLKDLAQEFMGLHGREE
jgi:hypothetical protein